jgi:hypothetical protein
MSITHLPSGPKDKSKCQVGSEYPTWDCTVLQNGSTILSIPADLNGLEVLNAHPSLA